MLLYSRERLLYPRHISRAGLVFDFSELTWRTSHCTCIWLALQTRSCWLPIWKRRIRTLQQPGTSSYLLQELEVRCTEVEIDLREETLWRVACLVWSPVQLNLYHFRLSHVLRLKALWLRISYRLNKVGWFVRGLTSTIDLLLFEASQHLNIYFIKSNFS